MALNIDPDNDDPFYRYKLHKPSIGIEGKNQNSRTLIKNIDQIATDLEAKPEQILKFIALKKGTRCNYAKEKSMVKTILTQDEVLVFIYDFVKKYVLCKKCNNPEADRIGIEPIEVSIRDKVGVIISPNKLDQLPVLITSMVANKEHRLKDIIQLRGETVFNINKSAQIGAAPHSII